MSDSCTLPPGAALVAALLAQAPADDSRMRRFLITIAEATVVRDLAALDEAAVAEVVRSAARAAWGREQTAPRTTFLVAAVGCGVIAPRAAVAAGADPIAVSPDRERLATHLQSGAARNRPALQLLAAYAIENSVAPTALDAAGRAGLAAWVRERSPGRTRAHMRAIERFLDEAPRPHSETLAEYGVAEHQPALALAPLLGGDGLTLDLIARTLYRDAGWVTPLPPTMFRLVAALFARGGTWWSLADLTRQLADEGVVREAAWLERRLDELNRHTNHELPIEREPGRIRVRWESPATVHQGPTVLSFGTRGLELDLCTLEVVQPSSGERHGLVPTTFQLLARIALNGAVDLRGLHSHLAPQVHNCNRFLARIGVAERLTVRKHRVALAHDRHSPWRVTCGDLELDLVALCVCGRESPPERGVIAKLSSAEAAVLAAVMRHPGRARTWPEISEQVYGHGVMQVASMLNRVTRALAAVTTLECSPGRYGLPAPDPACTDEPTPRYRPYPRHGFVLDVDRARIAPLVRDPGPGTELSRAQLRILLLLAEAPDGRLHRAQLVSPTARARALASEIITLDAIVRHVASVGVGSDDTHVWLTSVAT